MKKKFSGTENNFEFKLIIFFEKCRRAELSFHVYLENASLMLSKKTLSVFYANRFFIFTFDEFCRSIQSKFESFE